MISEYKVRYDSSLDVLYIRFREGNVVDSDEIEDGLIIDYDNQGNIIGIEVLEFSKRRIDLNELITNGFRVVVKS